MPEVTQLSLAAVRVGDILAAPLVDETGMILLPAGAVVTDALLERLRRRNTSTLTVSRAAEPEDLSNQREAVRQRILHLFRHTANNPGSSALLHAVIRFRQEQCQ